MPPLSKVRQPLFVEVRQQLVADLEAQLERVAQPLAQAAGLTDPDDRLLEAVIRP